jgi:hypothetical protein
VNSTNATDVSGCENCLVEIKLLGVLRMLGRNWCSDDIAEATGMGESTGRNSFVLFNENFVAAFYDDYIYRPVGDKLKNMMAVYKKMGLAGCIGTTDCVHVKWDRCPVELTNLCKGKEGYPMLSYSVTVDHSGRILGVMGSNYGTRNDKTIVHRDAYITDVHDGIEKKDLEYELYVDGVLTIQKGVYYLCDGGYHNWGCMMNPMKHTSLREQRLWSEWVESTRKDVEYLRLDWYCRIKKRSILCFLLVVYYTI